MDSRFGRTKSSRSAAAALCALVMLVPASLAQAPGDPALEPPDAPQAAPLLSPDQLDNLVAPIALYPDPLLGQVLSASTYPLEVVQAQQWLGQNGSLQGAQLMNGAQQQNWDPSVQALVMFPNALALLANDIRWTTDLGNAFLAQQADVMTAVQRMRARAKANGRLTNTPQQVVTVASEDGQDAIEIQPADPQIMYVPVYSPSYVWGQPAWGAYPDLWYPDGFGYGYGFGPGYYMGSYFSNWGGWGGWGWGCGWFGRNLYLNSGFFNRYRFRGGGFGHNGGFGRGFGGRSAWTHNPGHRMGVPYSNRGVADRFGGGQWNRGRADSGRRGFSQSNGGRSQASEGWQRFRGGNPNGQNDAARGFGQSGESRFRSNNRGDAGFGSSRGFNSSQRGSAPGSYSAPNQSAPRNFNGRGSSRSYSAPSQNYSGQQSFSNQRNFGGRGSSAPSQNYSAPRSFSSPRNFGGGGGGSSRSFSAPSQNHSAPRSFSSPRNFGGGGGGSSRSFSAPSHNSAPRGGGGGGGFSRGNSGSSGGHSRGGGGGGGHRR